jgi:flagellar hook-basal body protein
MKIFINGIDSGSTVGTTFSTSTPTSLPISPAISVPAGAAISFYDKDNSFTLAASPATLSTITSTTPSATSAYATVAVGDKLFLNDVDTGITVTSKSYSGSTSTFVLSAALPSTSTSLAAVFKHPLAMTLITPDGTEVAVSGASNKKASLEILTTTVAQVEVYASIDGKFYDYATDGSASSNRSITPEVSTGASGYKAVATMNFMGGQNIDAMVKDSMSGNPMFKTTTQLTSRVTNQAGGSSDLIFELDLSGTQLHAGAFQMTKSTQNGEAVARLTNVTVDNQGRIVGVYGSGKQQFIGQVAMVNFDNETGLIPVGKNAFTTSNITGTEQDGTGVSVGRAGTGVMGEIRSQALESSNVDLANELVRLMILQRSYSANSQSLKAVDQTLRDTLQMVG